MAKDPAFLFYPGDYLRDTQCLSERAQVAYDRIMCEHMRNICITQANLNFFTKRLSDEEKKEISHILTKIEGGYQIDWVAESIMKRQAYSDSRRSNRVKKSIKPADNISLSHDSHMENEDVNDNAKKNMDEKYLIPEMFAVFKTHLPKYPGSIQKDFQPLRSIADFIHEQNNLNADITKHSKFILQEWGALCEVVKNDKFYKNKALSTISNQIQAILQIKNDGSNTVNGGNSKSSTGRYQSRGQGGY